MLCYSLGEDAELRLLMPYHAEEFTALVIRNEQFLGRWLGFVRNYDLQKAKDFINHFLGRLADDTGIFMGIFYQDALAGAVNQRWDRSRLVTEIAYLLGAEYQGKGLMTRAVKAMTDYAFGDLGLRRSEIVVQIGNERSAAVAKRAGYWLEGIREQLIAREQQSYDAEMYVALATRWNGNS